MSAIRTELDCSQGVKLPFGRPPAGQSFLMAICISTWLECFPSRYLPPPPPHHLHWESTGSLQLGSLFSGDSFTYAEAQDLASPLTSLDREL